MAPRRSTDPATLFASARAGDRVALPRLLSLVERGGDGSRAVAAVAYRSPGQAYTVGITGAPGAGKSTLTDQLIKRARTVGLDGSDQVAVLAIDPSSPFSGGAILGDRVRMQNHALDDKVFIRSMATRGHLGGLAVAVPDAVRVLSAVGVPVVLVETVGVGQQEVAVAAATDTTIVVVNPGWGDAIQANKAGLLEIADLFVINKADRPGARETRRDLELMLDLTDLGPWRPPIVETVASTGEGVEGLWAAIGQHRDHQIEHGTLDRQRRERLEREFRQILVAQLTEQIDAVLVAGGMDDLRGPMLDGGLDPYVAADRVLERVMPRGAAPSPDPSSAAPE
jgi:LAO/AO transport system kinase